MGLVSTIEHEEIVPGRDHFVRIRQLDCSCTVIKVINLHNQLEGTLQELRRRLRCCGKPFGQHTLMVWVSSWVTSMSVIWMRERVNSRHQTFIDGLTSRAAALLAAFLRSAEFVHPYITRKDERACLVPSTRYPHRPHFHQSPDG